MKLMGEILNSYGKKDFETTEENKGEELQNDALK